MKSLVEIKELLASTLNASITEDQVKTLLKQALIIEHEHGILIGRLILDGEVIFNINQLAVYPTYQGQGVGTHLLKDLEKKLNGKVARIRVQSLEVVAHFYVHRGFRRVGESFVVDGKTYNDYEKQMGKKSRNGKRRLKKGGCSRHTCTGDHNLRQEP